MKKLFVVFLLIIFYTCYLVFTKLLFGDDNLVSIKGKFPKYFKMIRTSITKEQNTEIANLIFRLDKDERTYRISTEVSGIKSGAEVFSGVALSLKEAGEIEVYIRKAKIATANPKVYQIKADGKQIFHILKNPENNSRLFLILLLFILLFCSAYYWLQCLNTPLKKTHRRHKWHFN